MLYSTIVAALLAGPVSAALPDWQQCGGNSYSGDTECASGSGCVAVNAYYSQCQPGTSVPSASTPTSPDPTAILGTSPDVPDSSSTSTPLASGPGTTLIKGYYWVRAVTSPNFHKYMQSKPLYSTGPAVLGDYTTAAQLAIVDGQLTQLVSGASETPAKVLYAVVSQTRSLNNLSLAVSWSEGKNTYGSFAWGGDDLQWTVSGVTRPNLSAWYVCSGQQMYINLGNYLYGTPSGCADQTIHYYNDAHAVN